MKEKILISLLAIALVSGCSSFSIPGVPGLSTGTSVGGGLGLEMTSFTADPTSVYSGNTVRVVMDVENLGGSTAYMSSSFVYLTGSNMKLTDCSGLYWCGKDQTTDKECQNIPKDMKPADVVRGTPGDTKTMKWNLVAPTIKAGQTRTDSFIGRVYSDYETGVNGNIWLYTEAEADAARASGRALNRASFTTTSGPVSVDVSLSPDPIIVYESGGDSSASLNVRISNLATGTIYKPGVVTSCNGISISIDDLNNVKFSISAPDFTITDCTSGEIDELVSGKPTTVFCTLSPQTPSDIKTFRSYPVTISVDYGYFTEKTASVTVQGRTSSSS